MFNIILQQTLLCAMTEVQRATKMSVAFVRNLMTKMKCGNIVLLAKYDSMRNVLKNNLSSKSLRYVTLKMSDINSDVNNLFLYISIFKTVVCPYSI